MTNHTRLTRRAAVSSAAFALALFLSACSYLGEDEFRELSRGLSPLMLAIGPILHSPWLSHAATQEQWEHALRGFQLYQLQNQPPAGFWARLCHDHETRLQRQGVTHIAVPVPASGKVPAGLMLVDVHSGKLLRDVYERRRKWHRLLKEEEIVTISGHKSLVFAPPSPGEPHALSPAIR